MFRQKGNEQMQITPFIPQQFSQRKMEETHEAAEKEVRVDYEALISEARAAADELITRAQERIERERLAADTEILRRLESARKEAENIIAEARETAVRERELAKNEGYSEGRTLAETELAEQYALQEDTFRQLLGEIDDARNAEFERMEDEICDLVLAATEKIIRIAGESGDDIFKYLVKNAVETLRPQTRLTLRVSPDDFDRYFPDGAHVIKLDNGKTVEMTVERDKTLNSWDCVLDDGETVVDAGLDSQLVRVRFAFEHSAGEENDE